MLTPKHHPNSSRQGSLFSSMIKHQSPEQPQQTKQKLENRLQTYSKLITYNQQSINTLNSYLLQPDNTANIYRDDQQKMKQRKFRREFMREMEQRQSRMVREMEFINKVKMANEKIYKAKIADLEMKVGLDVDHGARLIGLQTEIQGLRIQNQQYAVVIDKKEETIMSLIHENQMIKNRLTHLPTIPQENQRIQELNRQAKQSGTIISQLQQEIRNLGQMLQQKYCENNKLSTKTISQQQQLSQQQQKITEIQNTNKSLRDYISQFRLQAKQQKQKIEQNYMQELSALRETLKESQQNYQELLNHRMNGLEQEVQNAKLSYQKLLKQSTSEITCLQAEAQIYKQEAEQLRETIRELEKARDNLLESNQKMEEQIINNQEYIHDLYKQLDEKNMEIPNMQIESEKEMEELRDDLRETVNMIKKQLAGNQEEKEALEEINKGLEESNKELRQRNEELEQRYGQLEEKNGQLEDQVLILERSNSSLRKQLVNVNQYLHNLEQKYRQNLNKAKNRQSNNLSNRSRFSNKSDSPCNAYTPRNSNLIRHSQIFDDKNNSQGGFLAKTKTNRSSTLQASVKLDAQQ